MRISKLLTAVALTLAVTGCGNDQKKLARLESEQLTACQASQEWRGFYLEAEAAIAASDTAPLLVSPEQGIRDSQAQSAKRDTLKLSYIGAKGRCDLATRALNHFMR
jgi:hypothetical protein